MCVCVCVCGTVPGLVTADAASACAGAVGSVKFSIRPSAQLDRTVVTMVTWGPFAVRETDPGILQRWQSEHGAAVGYFELKQTKVENKITSCVRPAHLCK